MTSGIDQINVKIIKELLNDGRKTFVEIAKECNTSKDVVAKRYKQMKDQGIIVGATIQNSCACYGCSFVGNFLVHVQHGNLDYVVALVKKIPKVLNIYPRVLRQNMSVMVALKEIEDLEQVLFSIKKLPFVVGVDTSIWIGTRDSPENLSVLNINESGMQPQENGAENLFNRNADGKMDRIDNYIIEELALDGRMRFDKIAKSLDVSVDTVVRRFERLEENRDLKVVIQIDPTKIGYNAYALFNLSFSHETLAEKIEALTKVPDINFIVKTSGKFDIMLSIMLKDLNHLVTFQEEIAGFKGITNMEVDVEKMFHVWPHPREFISTF